MTKFSLLNNIMEFLPVMQVYRTLLPVGLALGVGIGFVGSTFTIRKHLKVQKIVFVGEMEYRVICKGRIKREKRYA